MPSAKKHSAVLKSGSLPELLDLHTTTNQPCSDKGKKACEPKGCLSITSNLIGSGRRWPSKIDIIGSPFSVDTSTDESALKRVVVP